MEHLIREGASYCAQSSDLSLCSFFTNIVPPMPEEGVQWMRCDECEKWRKLKLEVCCYTVVTLLLHCCCTLVTLL
jgi:hypothetical protein